jgi:hypothetical protein
MSENMASRQQSAKHLAARAVMAYRAGFPITLLSLNSSAEHVSGIASDWKSQREALHNDTKLLSRAFAFIYIGSIVDQTVGDTMSDELHKELLSEMSSALDARQTAVDWGIAESVTETNPFAHIGYKLASRLLRTDQLLIEALAHELTAQGTIEGGALTKWLDVHASPLNFDELETSMTY